MRNSINTSINTSIRNELKLNSQTKLWLNIISIPAVELKEKIEKAIEENPFLEYDIKSNHNNLDINSIIENTASNSKESLFEHLKSQISIVFNNKKDIELAELISTFINENGYLIVELGYEYYKKFVENFNNIKCDIKIYGETVLIIFEKRNL